MDINGIATNYYQMVYTNNKAAKAETGNSFAEIASRKVVEAEKETAQENTAATLPDSRQKVRKKRDMLRWSGYFMRRFLKS